MTSYIITRVTVWDLFWAGSLMGMTKQKKGQFYTSICVQINEMRYKELKAWRHVGAGLCSTHCNLSLNVSFINLKHVPGVYFPYSWTNWHPLELLLLDVEVIVITFWASKKTSCENVPALQCCHLHQCNMYSVCWTCNSLGLMGNVCWCCYLWKSQISCFPLFHVF